ncbi:MAG TPA: tyrosine-type recombinase/integrase [Spirochaetales bacterium]|jgi:integrase/recombinase XerD|nr:tyrosine-type recombinase/integrase [Spirochaetales bacterium]HQK35828.1 tyrosine-type recombinase/integrase [Spirochaetales bacterium]
MLENYFDDPRTNYRLSNCGVFSGKIKEFAEYLHDQEFSRNVVREYLRAAAHLSRFALWEGINELSQLDESFACRFVNEHLPKCSCERLNKGKYKSTIYGIWQVLQFLSRKGIIPSPAELVKDSLVPKSQKSLQLLKPRIPLAPKQSISGKPSPPRTDIASQALIMDSLPESMGGIILQYDEYLDSLFGLCKKTRDIHRLKAILFLKWVYEKHGFNFQLSSLCAQDILEFQKMCNEYGYSNDYRKTITSCLRGFLRFLRWQRILEDDLTPAVYKVKEWKMATVPKYIPYETAMQLLSAPDRETAKGKRDYLILLLMLQLGLRANEIIQIKLQDISLEKGELLIRHTKTHRGRSLPLTNEIADAIVDYLRVRPNRPQPVLILRAVIPYNPLTNSSALGSMVRRYMEELGINAPSYGTHLLRHSLATHLVNNGASFKDTADILGHTTIETTGIYAKVQIERLKDIALPFPCWKEVCIV